MRLESSSPPHIRGKETNRSKMVDVIIVLCIVYFLAFYFYGARSLFLLAVALVSSVAAELLGSLIAMRRPNLRDYSSLVTGLILPLLMPASVPAYVLITAVVFGICVAKFPFGGTGQNLFNPAAAGFAFAAINWPAQVFSYSVPLEHLPAAWEVTARAAQSPAAVLKLGGVPSLDMVEMVLGNFAGPMGCTNILVVAACLLFLVVRGTVKWQMPLAFLISCAGFAFLFPRAQMSGAESVAYELMSGMLLFGAVFMLTDPVTSPKRTCAKVAYSVVAGIVTMLFRRFGGFEECFAFSLLLANAFVPLFDLLAEQVIWDVRRALCASGKAKKLQSNQ